MNKRQMAEHIAECAGISLAQALRVIDCYHEGIAGELKQGGRVVLAGFGSYGIRERKARIGRNPRTGETIQIAAAKVPTFKAGKALKITVS